MPTDHPLQKRFLRLALINIASNLTVPLAGLVDTAMLGHLADIRFLAGVALASVLFDYIYWTFGFLRMGATGTTAQAWGRGDREETHRVAYRFLTVAALLATAVILLQVPLREAGFRLLSGAPGVEQAGRDYYNARIWGAPATLCNFVLVGWFLGREQSRQVLGITVAANVTNIVLNYVFIMRLGLAAAGAGLATMLSQYVALAVSLTIFLNRPHRVPWRWSEVLDRDRLNVLYRLNGNILVRTLCLVSAFAAFTNLSSTLGVVVLAANSILMRLFHLAAYLIDGAAFASESLAGIFRGRRDLPSLQRLFRIALLWGLAFAGLFLVALFVAPRAMLAVLTSHEPVVDLALAHAAWLIPVLVFGSLAFMYDGLFLGMTEGARLRNSMLLSTLVVFVPAAWVALRLGDNHVLWASMAVFMLARTVTLWLASRKLMRRFAAWRGPV